MDNEQEQTPKAMMPTATISVALSKDAVVHVVNATPAEALFLVIEHMANAGKVPVQVEKEGEPVERSAKAEIGRLRQKYSSKKLGMIFGKLKPELPGTFDEAIKAGTEFAQTTTFTDKEPLLTHNLI